MPTYEDDVACNKILIEKEITGQPIVALLKPLFASAAYLAIEGYTTSNSISTALKLDKTILLEKSTLYSGLYPGEGAGLYRDPALWTDLIYFENVRGMCVGLTRLGQAHHYAYGVAPYHTSMLTWPTDLVQIERHQRHVVALRSNGLVVASGQDYGGMLGVGGWTDVKQIRANYAASYGLRNNGTVYCAHSDVPNVDWGQFNVGSWTDVDKIYAGYYWIAGLRTDGLIYYAGNDMPGDPTIPQSFANGHGVYLQQVQASLCLAMGDNNRLYWISMHDPQGISSIVTGWTDIAACQWTWKDHVFAVKTNGKIVNTMGVTFTDSLYNVSTATDSLAPEKSGATCEWFGCIKPDNSVQVVGPYANLFPNTATWKLDE